MSYIIPNSNQFSTGKPGSYLTPSDLTVTAAGADLPDIQTGDIAPDDKLVIELFLRRNQFSSDKRPSGWINANRIINLPYEKQLKYLSGLDSNKLRSWYGTSDEDASVVRDYLTRHGATNLFIDQEQRTALFEIAYEQFRQAFLDNRPEILVNPSQGQAFYYNPSDFGDSYLNASGHQAKEFASAIIGLELYPLGNYLQHSAPKQRARPAISKGSYYPSEIADIYNFPSAKETHGGEGVGIGILGSGGNQFELLNQGNTFNKYLKAQGINIKTLGKVDSPGDAGADADWSESSLDYSVIRSVAPRADVKFSTNGTIYSRYAELIYDQDIDIISSSVGYRPAPGCTNLKQAFHELFLDAVLRGKSVVVAAGDQGTGNYEGTLLPNGQPTADFTSGDSAFLSVGGTALPPSTEKNRRKQINEITGHINEQAMWNEYGFPKLNSTEGNVEVYPTLQDEFTLDNLIGATFVGGLFDNIAGSSGVLDRDVVKMPAYQRRNLGSKWQNTGRRYPDVSVLAGSNTDKDISSSYSIVTLSDKDHKPIRADSGGTSASAPLLAGLLARITSGLRKSFRKDAVTGFINPYLYDTYNSKQRRKLFIDVPKGSNNASAYDVASNLGEWNGKYIGLLTDGDKGYLIPLNGTGTNRTLDLNLSSTGKGFDAASGLGSINGQVLFDDLSQIWSTL